MNTTTRQVISISLPQEMVTEVEQVSLYEGRTHSELVREAIRDYVQAHKTRIPVAKATAKEIKAIQRARREIARGEYVTLEDLLK